MTTAKTYAGWMASDANLADYLQPGDRVDDRLYWHCLEVVFPASMTASLLQMGEAYSHDAEGFPMYLTFRQRSGQWVYEGILRHAKY